MDTIVSLIINNYNYGRFLRQAIDSALNQTYPRTEVIVVDDGSTDDSADIIRSYGSRVRSILKKNGGQASAMNAGFACATGEIIAFLDSDDYLTPTAIQQIVAHWNEETDILHHRVKVINNAGDVLGYKPKEKTPLSTGDVVPILLRYAQYDCPPTSGLSYSRRILQKLMPIPEAEWKLCADTYLVLTAPFFAHVEAMPTSVVNYRQHDSNNYGRPSAQWLSPQKITTFSQYMAQRYTLINQLASERNLPVYEFPTEPFVKLHLYRAASLDYRLSEGAALYVRLFKNLWFETNFSWSYRLKKTVFGLLIVFAPRQILGWLDPVSFAQKRIVALSG